MFSADGVLQELLALAIAGIAVLFMTSKMLGWPKRKKSTQPNVLLGGRLARGLDRAHKTHLNDDRQD